MDDEEGKKIFEELEKISETLSRIEKLLLIQETANKKLTKAQGEVFNCIKEISTKNNLPTVEDIANDIGISKSTVQYHLNILLEKKCVQRHRDLKPASEKGRMVRIYRYEIK